ncbi:hypothetical protein KDA11_05300, partial [Candidatus Saccharibacteria bacterium]|nr:hypothetical protein [Candidatus Saccharibacteria bacterium]
MGNLFSSVKSEVTQEDVVKIITNISVQNILNCAQYANVQNTITQINAYCGQDAINRIDGVTQSNNVIINMNCLQSANTSNILTEDITSALMAKIETIDESLFGGIGSTTKSNLRQVIRREIENTFTTQNILNMFQSYALTNSVLQVNTNVGGNCSNIISGLNQSNAGKIISEAIAQSDTVNKAAVNIANSIDADVTTKRTQTAALWAVFAILIAVALILGVALIGSAMWLSEVPMSFAQLINPLNWCK